MLGRLWLVISGGWAIGFLLLLKIFSGNDISESDHTIALVIAFGPMIIGALLARVAMWVLRG
jgi:hypothetical protein